MSSKELRRAGVLARVVSGELKLVNAAVIMGVSYRHSKRLGQRYREEGAEGLKHRSAGRESNRKKPKKFRERVMRLVGKKYSGEEGERFGPTLVAEHLASDDHVEVKVQTLRRWMLSEGLWSRARKRRVHRQWRERKEHAGELVQKEWVIAVVREDHVGTTSPSLGAAFRAAAARAGRRVTRPRPLCFSPSRLPPPYRPPVPLLSLFVFHRSSPLRAGKDPSLRRRARARPHPLHSLRPLHEQ